MYKFQLIYLVCNKKTYFILSTDKDLVEKLLKKKTYIQLIYINSYWLRARVRKSTHILNIRLQRFWTFDD